MEGLAHTQAVAGCIQEVDTLVGEGNPAVGDTPPVVGILAAEGNLSIQSKVSKSCRMSKPGQLLKPVHRTCRCPL